MHEATNSMWYLEVSIVLLAFFNAKKPGIEFIRSPYLHQIREKDMYIPPPTLSTSLGG